MTTLPAATKSVAHAHDIGDALADSLYGSPPVAPAPYVRKCPTCGSDKPRACAATTANGETKNDCHFMPQPWTAFERARHDKFWAERGDEIAYDLRCNG